MNKMLRLICQMIRIYAKLQGISNSEALEALMPTTLSIIEGYIRSEFNKGAK